MAITATGIQNLYVAYYGRPADPSGLAYWLQVTATATATGVADEAVLYSISNSFGSNAEYTANFTGLNSDGIINKVYLNLFSHAPDPSGLMYWSSKLTSGDLNLAQIVQAVSESAVNANNEDGIAFTSKVSAAGAFTAALDTTDEILGYSGVAAGNLAKAFIFSVNSAATLATAVTTAALTATVATVVTAGNTVTGQTFTLTTGIDAVTGTAGNDTINAAVDSLGAMTFTSLDAVNGGAGTDTLNLISTGSLAVAVGATVALVEVVNVTAAAPITDADISGWTGVNTLNVVSSGAIAGVVAAATTDINVAHGIAGVEVNGGKNVVISNSTAGDINIGYVGVAAGVAAAGTVTATNTVTAGAVNVLGGTTQTLVAVGNIYASGATGTVTATSSTGTISVEGADALTATANAAITFTNGTTITANASGAVAQATQAAHLAAKVITNAASVKAVANTDTSGKAKLAAAAVETNQAYLATDIASSTFIAADQSLSYSIGKATADAVDAGAITLAQKVAIDAAFATGLVTSAAAAQTAAQAVLTPLQTSAAAASAAAIAADVVNDALAAAAKVAADALVAADAAAAALVAVVTVDATTNTALTSVTINGNAGGSGVGTSSAFQNAVTDGSTLSNTLTTVTLNNTGASELIGDALVNISATGMAGDVDVLNATVDHTQTFTLSGVTGGTYTESNATTIDIVSNGTAANVLTGLYATLATAVNLTGTAGLTFGTTTLAAAAVIDASSNSGSNTITTLATQTYTGGSGVDTVTSSNGAAQTKAIDGGAGVADKLIIGNTADFGTTAAAALFKNFETLQTLVDVDVSKFTGSAISKVIMSEATGGSIAVTGLSAAQALNITLTNVSNAVIGVTGAATVSQLDTVSIDVNDGAAGVNTISLLAPALTGIETLNLTATDNFTISALTSSTSLTNINVFGAGTVGITTGTLALNANTWINAAAATGAVTVDAALASVNGLKITGSATAVNTLTGSGTVSNLLIGGDAGDTITGGTGDDVISGGAGNNTIDGLDGADVITVGDGNNLINAGGIANTGVLTVTAGNGYNVIVGGFADDIITVGTGGNVITGGAGADTITFGAHAAGVLDGVVLAGPAETLTAITAAAMATAAGATLAGVDIITGLKAGDTIDLAALSATFTGTLATTIAAALGATASLVRGDYVAATQIFTASATGLDTLFVYDQDGSTTTATVTESIVLVGSVVTGTATAGIITLV